MSSSPSLARRATLALGLTIGFYVLALAIAGSLLFVGYAEFALGARVPGRLVAACVFGAGVILWSVLPRIDRFVAPGPRLTRAAQPRLFAEIEAIAGLTGQAPPAEVYLVGDVNAWVAQRGGWMGLGGRRVMGLGLPLLRTLTRAQLRAVLAHEFGHFHGGDARLGPLVYRTRGAIERTIQNLGKRSGAAAVLQVPFRGYGKMFLRVSHAVSRAQEHSADALAARTVGARPLSDGLRAIAGAAHAFQSYWRNECGPVFDAGFLPPLADGFADFLRAEKVAEAVQKLVSEELTNPHGDPYDTHPPLPERIAALAALPPGDDRGDDTGEDPLAITLLADVPALEAAWLATVAAPGVADKLKPIAWSAVGREVYAPYWLALAKANAASLSGLTCGALGAKLADAKGFGKGLVGSDGKPAHDGDADALARLVATAALGLALLERGARIDAPPGLAITLQLEGETLDPADLAGRLAEGKLAAEEWRALCTRLGLDALDLGGLASRG